ncbi:MAG TPA: nucleotidyltransferase family protein [Stellaceae bacterium]|nr:nucleotidyltransferase family protein [Stellaceae bacterium]
MSLAPKSGMVLAAGLGLRMRPITDRVPKPLVTLGGRALLDHAIDRLEAAGVERVVVNAHYKAEMIERHLAERRRPAVALSREEALLETGGGVLKALPLLDDVFYVVNADIFWLDGKTSALLRLARAFDPERHDALLLMQRTVTALGYDGPGDFIVDPQGEVRRRGEREVAPHLFAGVQLLSKRLFAGSAPGKFSLNPLYDRAIAAGRLAAIVHDGEWYHIGTPEGLALAEERLATHRTER